MVCFPCVKGLKISTNHKSRDNDYSAWRAGLRKTGSTSMVHERMSKENEDDRSLPRSASSPRLAFDPRIEDVSQAAGQSKLFVTVLVCVCLPDW